MTNRLALIGNAESLFTRRYGTEIDGHDVVARMNRAAILATKFFSTASHGSRTDAWFMWRHREYETYTFKRPDFSMQMASWEELDDTSIKLYPMEAFENLQNELGAVPSTGLMVLDFLDRYTNHEVSVYGFDWKATPTFTDPRRETDKMLLAGGNLHNFGREREYTQTRFYNNDRFNFRF